jgi:hypothetical protein
LPNSKTSIEIIFHQHVFAVRTLDLKPEGVVVELSDADFTQIKSGNNNVAASATLSVRFKETPLQHPIEGEVFQAELVYSFRISLDKFELYLAFRHLDKCAENKLREHMARS